LAYRKKPIVEARIDENEFTFVLVVWLKVPYFIHNAHSNPLFLRFVFLCFIFIFCFV